MRDTTLPINAVTGAQAIGWRKARRGETGRQPIWPILGASEDNADDGGDSEADSEDADTAADDQGDGADDQDDDSPVDWEAKAKELAAAVEAQKRINRNLERRTRRDKATIDKLNTGAVVPNSGEDKGAGKDDKSAQVDVDKIRAEAAAAAKAEAAAEALKERVLDKIEAKAKDFADPADAVTMLMRGRDADEFIDNGKIDVDAIQDALAELLEKKPYLGAAAQGGKNRFQGSAEGGAKPHKPQRPKSLTEAVRRTYESA